MKNKNSWMLLFFILFFLFNGCMALEPNIIVIKSATEPVITTSGDTTYIDLTAGQTAHIKVTGPVKVDIPPDPAEQDNSANNANKSAVQVNTTSGQCQAITQAGTQCKRNASVGSKYCWQHQNSESKEKVSSSSGSREIITGPRGGQYYINKNGKKTYVKRKKG